MENSPKSSLPPQLRAAQADIDRWRAGNGARRRIPEAFWLRATELAQHHSIHSVSMAMRLSHQGIKARLETGTVQQPGPARFVELRPSAAATFADLPPTLTLRFADETSRRVEVSGADSSAACRLITTFFAEGGR